MHQLLWLETLLKLAGGLLLTLAPSVTIKLLGLPAAQSTFWPRLLGATLLGIAAATFIEGTVASGSGLGLAGSIAINLLAAATLAALLILDAAAATRRGSAALWTLVVLLLVLSLFEIAHV